MEIRSAIKIYLYILSKMCYDVANIVLPLCFDYALCEVFLCITTKMPVRSFDHTIKISSF